MQRNLCPLESLRCLPRSAIDPSPSKISGFPNFILPYLRMILNLTYICVALDREEGSVQAMRPQDSAMSISTAAAWLESESSTLAWVKIIL